MTTSNKNPPPVHGALSAVERMATGQLKGHKRIIATKHFHFLYSGINGQNYNIKDSAVNIIFPILYKILPAITVNVL